jgi:hypothetical protein
MATAFGIWSRGNACITSANDDGMSAAAPTACTTRNAMWVSAIGARPQATDATVNSADPPRNTFRWPTRSATLPAGMSSAAKTIV